MKVCENCDRKVPWDSEDKFCRQCGKELEELTECPECDAAVAPEDKFCWKCGVRLDAEAGKGG